MTKYMKLYGVEVTHFPNEKENVTEKLKLARIKASELWDRPYSYEKEVELHEINQSIEWCRKILNDIEDN